MLNVAIALAAGIAVGLPLTLLLSPVEGILPGVAIFALAYFLLARRAMKRLEAVFKLAEKELLANRVDRAIQMIESGRALARWQFMVDSQIDAQLGMIHYIRDDAKKAQPFLERAFSRLWITSAMLGAIYYKKKDVDAMRKTFDKTVAVGKKQGLAWSVYAWCEWKLGNTERAIEILGRGRKAVGESDERLSSNLLALQNDKKMKMKSYGEQWYQFRLEKMPIEKQQVRFARN
ncbi:MAG: hypothetical protein JXR83_09645 [Deltaproteobacteria bacterium]|nr:hypothetical protein [Deltaproteobacteria bacterium]